jgi:hypothetical protein
MTFTALGIQNTPIFDERDTARFFELAGEKFD